MGSISHNTVLRNVFHAAIIAVDPYASVKPHNAKIRTSYKKGKFDKLILIGFGKASCPMAEAVHDELRDLITEGLVITKYGHCKGNSRGAITVHEAGLCGRNAELALSFALTVQGIDGISFLSSDTNGTDGPTDAAGAFVNGKTVTQARHLGLDPEDYLCNNDSYNFFKRINSLFITGPTGTNVMDIQMVIIE